MPRASQQTGTIARTVTCCGLILLLLLSFALLRSTCRAAESVEAVAPRTDRALAVILAPGTKVRVDAPSLLSSRLAGTVVTFRSDTLEVTGRVSTSTGRASTWAGFVPLSAIHNLERSYGSKGHSLLGMGLGLLAGVVIGTATNGSTSNNEIPDYSPILFGAGGVIVGGILGAQFRTEQWEKVQIGPPGFETPASPGAARDIAGPDSINPH